MGCRGEAGLPKLGGAEEEDILFFSFAQMNVEIGNWKPGEANRLLQSLTTDQQPV